MNLSEKMHSAIILAYILLGADRCKEFIQHSCISLVVHPSVFLADFLHLMYLKHILFALMLQAINFFHILSATFIFPLYFPILMVKTSIFWRNPSHWWIMLALSWVYQCLSYLFIYVLFEISPVHSGALISGDFWPFPPFEVKSMRWTS